MTINFTIKVTDETMVMYLGKMPRSRPMWHADGVVFYVLGPLGGMKYEQAANLALQQCCAYKIPAAALKRYSSGITKAIESEETKTRRMKGF